MALCVAHPEALTLGAHLHVFAGHPIAGIATIVVLHPICTAIHNTQDQSESDLELERDTGAESRHKERRYARLCHANVC